MKQAFSLFLILITLLAFIPHLVLAASCTWNGSVDNKWGSNGNWTGCTIPSSGDSLTFPSGTSNTNLNNDISGLTSITSSYTGGTYSLDGNSYTGTADLLDTNLTILGSFSKANFNATGANTTLRGTGTTGVLNITTGAILRPGNNAPGILSASGSVSFSSKGIFTVDLNGVTLGSGYSQLTVSSTLDLTGADLVVNTNFTPAIGSQFIIINETGEGFATGTFNGLPEGATVTSGNTTYQITYRGGDGNDVVLTTLTTSTTTSSNSGGSSTTTIITPTGCDRFLDPKNIPDLFQIDYNDTQATLFINPKNNILDSLQVLYGFPTDTDNRYGAIFKNINSNLWIQQVQINDLTPNTAYYFKTKSGNGCSATDPSNTLIITTLKAGNKIKSSIFAH